MTLAPIAFICHPYHRGGVTRWMVDMATACAEKKMEVYFITIEPRKPFFSAGGRETLISLLEQVSDLKLVSVKAGWEFEFATEQYKTQVYAELLKREVPPGANIILADDKAIWALSAQLHDTYNFVGVLHADEDYYYDLAIRYKKVVAQLVCVSKRIRQNLLMRDEDISDKKIFVIPCGIPMSEVITKKENKDFLQIIYVGRITQYQKRVFDIPLICTSLKRMGVSYRLTVIGSGGDLQQLKTITNKLGLAADIRFTGWLPKDQIFEHMRQADILLLTSDFEGMPVAVMEALSSGCGIVSTKVSGIEDYADNPLASTCIGLYDVGNVDSAVEQLSNLGRLAGIERAIQARQLAEAEFSINLCLERYLHSFMQKKAANGKFIELTLSNVEFTYSLLLSLTRYLRVSLGQKMHKRY
jgi:glycosyltransferase involved in cell wall biosynthesis